MLLFILQSAIAGPMLDTHRPARPCRPGTSTSGDVVVCGKRADQEKFRLRRFPDDYSSDPNALPKAETSILGGGAKLAAETEVASVGGFQSNRVMIRLKIPTGKSKPD